MVNALVIRPNTHLAKAEKALRAAQYVRMSTDYQHYSTENQAATIAAYAARQNLKIVRTYADDGRSGLRISNRSALVELINDIRFGKADFSHVLVYDVSRWGRFQDTDESAHYEFICKQAGVKVTYCAEQFENDGGMLSSIVKNLKRVMAAEYSRELSVKVHAGACKVASMGFRGGGAVGYGLRRELVDEKRRSKGILQKGERKHLQTHHVLLRPGPARELRIVRRIFREFVVGRHSQAEIARRLNQAGIPNHRDKPWSDWMIHYLLQNENYIGNLIYNRSSYRLRNVRIKNPSKDWIRSKAGFDPIVSERIFAKAQERMKTHYVRRSDEQLLAELRDVLSEKGQLSADIMNKMPAIPSPALYAWRFGSLRNAFERVGYRPQRNYDYIDQRPKLNQQLLDLGDDVARRIRALGASSVFDAAARTLNVENRLTVSLRIGRYYPDQDKVAVWHVHRNANLPSGWILALRLNKKNTKIVDYFVIPTTEMKKIRIALRATLRYSRFDKYHAPSIRDAVRMIMEAVAATSPTCSPKQVPKGLARSVPTRIVTGRAQH
jgi:DNA invertase Pin-like site-specific DNA recombinase